MSTLFADADDRRFAEVVSRLVYCNPFIEERVRLEARALGADFDEKGRDWNLDPRAERRHDNMRQLLARIEGLVEDRLGFFRDGRGNREERLHFAELVLFLLYHRAIGQLDRMIAESHAEGIGQRRVTFYREFVDHYRHYLGESGPIPPAHLFACYFQIRRAFYHIFHFFIGASPAATALRARLWQSIFTHDLNRYQRALYHRMARIPTLVTGPSGSGKEVVARAIGLSRFIPFDEKERVFEADFTRAFFPVNLSALSPTLIESELFGHRKGAFTGALQDREGYFAACGAHGTVFLDEIGEADLGIQVKLLRVLQTRQFQRLGDVRGEGFQGKVVAATNRDLSEGLAQGTFREDFYFRLRSDVIETLSLEQLRGGSDRELAFLAEYAAERLVGPEEAPALREDFLRWAGAHPGYRWPGNFRELEQALRSILVHGDYSPPKVGTGGDQLAARLAETGWTLKELTTVYISELYRRVPNYEELARRLEVDRRTVRKYAR
jgi:transcriptional regulator with AAA-type ATPase domain